MCPGRTGSGMQRASLVAECLRVRTPHNMHNMIARLWKKSAGTSTLVSADPFTFPSEYFFIVPPFSEIAGCLAAESAQMPTEIRGLLRERPMQPLIQRCCYGAGFVDRDEAERLFDALA